MIFKSLPSIEYLHSRLLLDADTGMIRFKPKLGDDWKIRSWNSQHAGEFAGHVIKSRRMGQRSRIGGELHLTLDGEKWIYSRIVWKMITGEDPEFEIDHINRDRSDNRFTNLRDVNHSVNMRNSYPRTKCIG